VSVPLLTSEQFWSCPNCSLEDRTTDPRANPFHRCHGLAGLTAPLVPAGTKCKVTAHEREDFVGRELVPLHEGRPVAQVRTERDDGSDCLIFAPTARVLAEGAS
jgi:hypothetical protein